MARLVITRWYSIFRQRKIFGWRALPSSIHGAQRFNALQLVAPWKTVGIYLTCRSNKSYIDIFDHKSKSCSPINILNILRHLLKSCRDPMDPLDFLAMSTIWLRPWRPWVGPMVPQMHPVPTHAANTLWLWLTVRYGKSPLWIGKPSISIRAIYTMAMLVITRW